MQLDRFQIPNFRFVHGTEKLDSIHPNKISGDIHERTPIRPDKIAF